VDTSRNPEEGARSSSRPNRLVISIIIIIVIVIVIIVVIMNDGGMRKHTRLI
jgi:t-SNARE complex subunit (syntaxin)